MMRQFGFRDKRQNVFAAGDQSRLFQQDEG
jgi:hypothetical protein